MTRFWWVRHGPTHQTAFTGWRDVPADLSDTAAIAQLAMYLPSAAIIVSSDLSRARMTADAIAGSRARLPDDPALREFDFGAWDGLTFDAVAVRDPDLSRAFWDEPGDVAPPDGESWNALAGRVAGAVSRLQHAHANQDIIAVAHIGVIMSQIGRCHGQSPLSAIGHRIEPLSVTRIDVSDGGQTLGPVNHRP